MGFPLRYRVSLLVFLATVLATAAVFVFARPEYHARYESKMIDFSKQHYYTPAEVLAAFDAHGVRLQPSAHPPGIMVLSNERAPLPADALQVMIGPRKGQGSWGPQLERYDERVGNVFVTYGGNDEQLLSRVKAAVSALR